MPTLEEQARVEQVRVKLDAYDGAAEVWPLLDLARLGDTFGPWMLAMGRMVLGRRDDSARLSRAYVLASKEAAGVPGRLLLPNAAPVLTPDRVTGNLLVDVARAGRLAREAPESVAARTAAEKALVRVQGTAARLSVEAGREVVLDVVQNAGDRLDAEARRALEQVNGPARRAAGKRRSRNVGPKWYRTVSGSACKFCALLAGRGAVYREDSVTFNAHDHCACGAALQWTE